MTQKTSTTEPLLGGYSVVYNHRAEIPMREGYVFSDAPSLAKTSDGGLLCAVPLKLHMGVPEQEIRPLHFFRSDDGGATWSKLPETSDFGSGTLFRYGSVIYFIGIGPGPRVQEGGAVRVIYSEDDGQTWSRPADIFSGEYLYQPASGYVVRDGQFYWCFDSGGSNTYAMAGDLEAELADPASWRISNPVHYPGSPPSLMTAETVTKRFQASVGRWIEGNVIESDGELRVCWRVSFSGSRRGTKDIAIVCDLEDDGRDLRYRFAHFSPWPGASNHFHVIKDEVTGYFWMTSNVQFSGVTPEIRENMLSSKGHERRLLALYCGYDELHWVQTGYVMVWPLMRQSSNYCGLLIDGDDLLVVSRTSRDGLNQHDNDLTTFHRVKNFRQRADILPARLEEGGPDNR